MYQGMVIGSRLSEFAAHQLLENMRLLKEGGYCGGESLDWGHSVSLLFLYSLFYIRDIEINITSRLYKMC